MPGKDLTYDEKQVLKDLVRKKQRELELQTHEKYPDIDPLNNDLPINQKCKAKLISMHNRSMRNIAKHTHKTIMN